MPTYSFLNKKTGEETTVEMKIAEREAYLKENPDLEQIITNASYVHDIGGIKTDNGWKSMLNRIKRNNAGSTINVDNLGEI